jgi:hypothetical protein
MSSQQISIKASLNGTIRRFQLTLEEPEMFFRLQVLITQTFGGNYALKFLDDEEELCTVGSDAELIEAITVTRSCQRSNLKLFLSAIQNNQVRNIQNAAEPVAQAAASPDSEEKKSKQHWMTLMISFLQDANITCALPQVLELFVSQLSSCSDEKNAAQLLDNILIVYPQLAQHPLISGLSQVECSQRQCLVQKIVSLSVNAEIVRQFLPQLTAASPQLVASLPSILEQARDSLERGAADTCTVFAPLLHRIMPLVGPLMFSIKSNMAFGPFGSCASASESSAAQAEVNDPDAHIGINCDHCQQKPITGVRFKCQVCPDYDLCAACETKNVHPLDHPLIKMRQPTRKDIHRDVQCDGCQATPIVGARFKCTVCPNFDLCAACEAKGEHPTDHALLKLRVSMEEKCGRGRRYGHGGHGRRGVFGGMFGGHGRGRGRGRGRQCAGKRAVPSLLKALFASNLTPEVASPEVPTAAEQHVAPVAVALTPVSVRDDAVMEGTGPVETPALETPAPDQLVKEKETHVNIWCDECKMRPIMGPRFKCQVCPDFDLCGGCMTKCLHNVHPLARVRVSASVTAPAPDSSDEPAPAEEKHGQPVELAVSTPEPAAEQSEVVVTEVPAVEAKVEEEAEPEPEPNSTHASQMAALESMGFQNRVFNERILAHFKGDLAQAVNYLLVEISKFS